MSGELGPICIKAGFYPCPKMSRSAHWMKKNDYQLTIMNMHSKGAFTLSESKHESKHFL